MNTNGKTRKEDEERVAEEYLSSLADLNCNSKPLINMLTMLAEENIEYAPIIVRVVEQHIHKVLPEFKLPILYLIDSIIKNVKGTYVQIFSQCIVNIFCGVFEKVNEKVRERMYALRLTWNEVFSVQKLYTLDVKVKQLDQNWPITAKITQPSIHVNPNFLKGVNTSQVAMPTEVEEILQAKTRELLELKKRKLELELEATKKRLEEQAIQLTKSDGIATTEIDDAAGMTQNVTMPAHAPHMFQGNVRTARSQAAQNHFAAPNNMQINSNNLNKLKVHPVNPALLNTVRHRDPRLARQQQQQQQHQMQLNQNNNSQRHSPSTAHAQPSRASIHEDAERAANDVSKSSSSSSYRQKSRTNSKSPTRSPNYSGRSSNSRFNSNSSSNKSSDKSSKSDKQRRHSSSSSSSSKKNNERRSKSSNKTAESSPSSISSNSPSKNRDSRRHSASTTKQSSTSSPAQRRKTRSRSTSPANSRNLADNDEELSKPMEKRHKVADLSTEDNKIPSLLKSTKDLEKNMQDMFIGNTTTMSATTNSNVATNNELQQRIPLHNNPFRRTFKQTTKRSGQSRWTDAADTNAITLLSNNNNSMTHLNQQSSLHELDKQNNALQLQQQPIMITDDTCSSSTSNANKVSFRIIKALNKKIDKFTTEHLTTNIATAAPTKVITRNACDEPMMLMNEQFEVNQNYEDGKRKFVPTLSEEEPIIKKPKSLSNNKSEDLFGENDLNTDQPPTPPKFSFAENEFEDWSSNKKNVGTKTSLEDVRAKLAKAAKYNKVGNRFDKSNRELTQRLKLTELQANEDSQEANDEKIRTILTQAQELLDAKSINQEQYKNLLQTAMSINESNKLKEAKRRESLNALREEETNEEMFEKERLAARDAILKKRIPKINKSNNNNTTAMRQSPLTTTANDSPNNSPLYEDNADTINNSENLENNRRQRLNRDKRQRPSKWGERVEANSMQIANANANNARNWPAPHGIRPNNFRPHLPNVIMANNNIRLPQFNTFNNNNNNNNPNAQISPMLRNTNIPPPPQPPMALRLPIPPSAAASAAANSINNPQADLVRSITVDGQSKEIRIYGAVAIVFMDLDQPREIGFKPGQRAIVIDDGEPIVLQFNDVYKPVQIAGVVHQMRFGFPSRELYIDDNWYEIYFGGVPVSIPIDGKLHLLTAEGPPPQVHIGPLRRDLVVGKINMIVDAHIIIPLFLDAHTQTFQLRDQQHTIQFADNLLTVLLDGKVAKVEYGGLPKSYTLGGQKYFIRFTALPQGVVAGKVNIKNMMYMNTEPAVEAAAAATASVTSAETSIAAEPETNVTTSSSNAAINISALSNLNIDELFQKLVSTGILSAGTATVPVAQTVSTVDTESKSEAKAEESNVQTNSTTNANDESKSKEHEDLPGAAAITPIDLNQPESIKTRQQGIVNMLFHGMQCSSCGVRFPPEQTIKYSQHLDWHFRQNRRERDATRKAHSRKWYYNIMEWLQYKEIEDLEEREKNYFESQQQQIDADDDESASNTRAHSPEPTCAAGPDDVDRGCDMCHEKFEQFYNEELEEWHLRCAIKVEDKIYHPLCYEDYKTSLNPVQANDQEKQDSFANSTDDNAMDIDLQTNAKKEENADYFVETAVIDDDDDDDDVIVLPNEEPIITELDDDDDDDAYVPVNVTRDEMGSDVMLDAAASKIDESAKSMATSTAESDADIEIQEPHIPFTDLDTYVEKELPESLDDSSQLSYKNVKIKEEPKDDDEDDGFEEVGTVLISADDEITINSEETQSQLIDAANNGDIDAPVTPIQVEAGEEITNQDATEAHAVIDGNLETQDKHNLSAAAANHAPVIPLASLVNKIKINITKNTNNNSNNATNTTASATTTTNSTVTNSAQQQHQAGETISTLSGTNTICNNAAGDVDHMATTDGSMQNTSAGAGVLSASSVIALPVVPQEEAITFEVKPALQNVPLKKTKKVECGVETSGLCSIM